MSLTVVPRTADRRTEVDNLRMEVDVLLDERGRFGQEIGWLSRLIVRGVLQGRNDLLMEVAGRLDHLAERLIVQSDQREAA